MRWEHIKPGRVVWAVLAAEMVGLWVVAGMEYIYQLQVNAVDMQLNMVVFSVVAAWWTDVIGR